AGLCGSMLALRLGQRGYQVRVMEKRPDLRSVDISAGRSINLAFSDRGMKAVTLVGLQDKVKPLCIPMHGRMLHDRQGNTKMSNYSGRDFEFINSISRQHLTALLMDEAEKLSNVTIEFNKECTDVDFEKKRTSFYCKELKVELVIESDVIIGADGAGSALRKSYYLSRKFLFSFSQNFLSHGYKELTILPDDKGEFKTDKNALHIWPRGDYMLIALPNLDGSFTVTLFLSYSEGDYNFDMLTEPEAVMDFFRNEFPDALALMPHIVEEFFENPTAPLGMVKCSPWHYQGNSLLIGDAAHAIVPFYGQGMNASFEDVVVLDHFIGQHEGNWEAIFKAYENERKKDTDAIADLAIDNFYEMRDHVASDIFQKKRELEMALESRFPDEYSSKYSLVTFNENIGYRDAMVRGRAQDKAILNMIADGEINLNDNMRAILDKIVKSTEDILEDDRVARTMRL
ncbi:MAG: FAD-dependent monooxygenase, partial [Flavobacteriaceae bacterium]|nr:FAD-dependent monooxygenase [Flavobacteriaceae bacterium]